MQRQRQIIGIIMQSFNKHHHVRLWESTRDGYISLVYQDGIKLMSLLASPKARDYDHLVLRDQGERAITIKRLNINRIEEYKLDKSSYHSPEEVTYEKEIPIVNSSSNGLRLGGGYGRAN